MTAVTLDAELKEIDHDVDWHWRLTKPAGSPDVVIDLAPLFADWDADELAPVMHSIARSLQYAASMLLSNPLTEEAPNG